MEGRRSTSRRRQPRPLAQIRPPAVMVAVLILVSCAAAIMAGMSSAEARVLKKKKKTPQIPAFTAYNYLSRQGPNSTEGYNTVQCGGPAAAQANEFGDVFCFDMPLLAEQSVSGGREIGRVQGTYAFVQQEGGIVFVSETFRVNSSGAFPFLQGEFSGVGLEHIGQVSSKPIVGGIGDFALALGVAITTPLPESGVDQFGNLFFWFKYRFTFG